jgi:hypothetical protein
MMTKEEILIEIEKLSRDQKLDLLEELRRNHKEEVELVEVGLDKADSEGRDLSVAERLAIGDSRESLRNLLCRRKDTADRRGMPRGTNKLPYRKVQVRHQ